MPDETEPTPATPTPDAAEPTTAAEHAETASSGVRAPKWLAVGAIAAVLAGGGFAVGHVTASDHHHDFAPIGDNRPGGPGGRDGRGGFGGPGGRDGGDANGPGATNGNGNGTGDASPDTTPSTTPSTGT